MLQGRRLWFVKTASPLPLEVTCDKAGRCQLQRVGFLGEGDSPVSHKDVSQDQEGQGRAACGTEIKIHRLLTLSPFTTASMPSASNSNMSMGSAAGRAIASNIAQQKAVHIGNIHDRNGPGRDTRDSPLFMRKFQAAQGGSPLRRVAKDAGEDEEMRARKEPESQKARIAAQMAPVPEADGDDVPFLMPWITSPKEMNSLMVLRKRQGVSSGKHIGRTLLRMRPERNW
ncbi:hypothetical protein F5887DRAFT_1074533 [Amanita rubescens]|nr:hypothetical protein F5887DRAFT_1074533 [Amanita rubescens]